MDCSTNLPAQPTATSRKRPGNRRRARLKRLSWNSDAGRATELAMKFSSKRQILCRGLCAAEFRAPALPRNSFDPTQPDQQGEAECQGHCPGVKRNAEASGFFGHIGGFGLVRHCFSFSTAARGANGPDFRRPRGPHKEKARPPVCTDERA